MSLSYQIIKTSFIFLYNVLSVIKTKQTWDQINVLIKTLNYALILSNLPSISDMHLHQIDKF